MKISGVGGSDVTEPCTLSRESFKHKAGVDHSENAVHRRPEAEPADEKRLSAAEPEKERGSLVMIGVPDKRQIPAFTAAGGDLAKVERGHASSDRCLAMSESARSPRKIC